MNKLDFWTEAFFLSKLTINSSTYRASQIPFDPIPRKLLSLRLETLNLNRRRTIRCHEWRNSGDSLFESRMSRLRVYPFNPFSPMYLNCFINHIRFFRCTPSIPFQFRTWRRIFRDSKSFHYHFSFLDLYKEHISSWLGHWEYSKIFSHFPLRAINFARTICNMVTPRSHPNEFPPFPVSFVKREKARERERSLSIERGNGVVNNASPGRAKIKRLKIRICWRVRLGRMFRIAAGASNLAHPFQTSRHQPSSIRMPAIPWEEHAL